LDKGRGGLTDLGWGGAGARSKALNLRLRKQHELTTEEEEEDTILGESLHRYENFGHLAKARCDRCAVRLYYCI
jgi:hypothetical protein